MLAKKILVFIGCLVGLAACMTEPTFDLKPLIGFKDASVVTKNSSDLLGNITKRDSVIITIDFQDGDGDLGFTQADLTKIQPPNAQSFVVNLYVRKNGTFLKSTPTTPIGANMPVRLKEGAAGPIEGTMDYGLTFDYQNFKGYPYLTGKKDTVYFDVWILDRALNKSNVVQTKPVVLFAN